MQWYPWCEEALLKAKSEDKLLLISIGYSACHWCHVMEHECFEDNQVAMIMNNYFICIKVDREERPDIDQVYMSAVQLMTGHGGWPLNCIALPDGRPIFGGTYFRKQQWMETLEQLAHFYNTQKDRAFEYADKLMEGINEYELVKPEQAEHTFKIEVIKESVAKWSKMFDRVYGGLNYAPKFPMPCNYLFLLRYGFLSNDNHLLEYVNSTLHKIAYGGIYDHIGGGFSRYSTDLYWKVPHFEKMLYDNAQLVSLYSESYQYTVNALYKKIVYETCDFVIREMMSDEGCFYSAYDADSEGVEGKFYVWKQEELKAILKNEFDLFAAYYNVNEQGYWEHGNYILLREKRDDEIATLFAISVSTLNEKIDSCKKKLYEVRNKRIKPGLDDKSLTSWNALMLKAFADAYAVFGEERFLNVALKNADFIFNKQKCHDGRLFHSYKAGKSSINGYLEDYAAVIQGCLALYRVTFNESWLIKANDLLKYTVQHFYDSNSGVFWFTSDIDPPLIVRKTEITDNVIPSSNSIMAHNLFALGTLFYNDEYLEMSRQMLNKVLPEINTYGSSYSNWSSLLLNYVFPFYEIAIVGDKASEKKDQLLKKYIPNSILLGTTINSNMPLLSGKYVKGKTFFYVCHDKTCRSPVENIEEIVESIK